MTHIIGHREAGPLPARRALLEPRLWGGSRAPAIPRRDGEGDAPLSFAQERLWFLDRVGQGGASCNLAWAVRVHGALEADALERALAEVVRRHDALRTTFREVDGVPVQSVAPFGGFVLPLDDVSSLAREEREAKAARIASAECARAFDLAAGPVFRARLVRLGDEEHVLVACAHHLVADGWSARLAEREAWTVYSAFRGGRPSPLPEPPLRFADFAAWQRDPARRQAEARSLEWWKERLAGAPELLALPTDHPRPPVPSFRGASVPLHLSAEVLEALRQLARDEGASLFTVVLAGFQLLLARYAATDDVVVGTPAAGRQHPGVHEVAGPFANALVLRTGLSGDPEFRELVRRARQTVLRAHEHQDVAFERLVTELRPERTLSHAALFQATFALQPPADPPVAAPGLRVARYEMEPRTTRFDLALKVEPRATGLCGALEYATDLFERGTARRMVEQLQRVLEQAAACPGRRLSRFELMMRPERERVIRWNRVTASYPAERCIHDLFEAQAAATPDATAVVCDGESLTYRELDARANRLARHLRALGVGPEVRVGLLLERGPWTMVAIFGVMKAGGAYVPIDPAYPAERVAYLLHDSAAAVLVTQRALLPRLPVRSGLTVVAVDRDWEAIGREPADAPPSGVTAENLAYVIYTSGSTGRPKGVAMHHRGVCNYIHWGVRAYGADRGSGAPVFSSLAVDLTITSLLPLFAGRAIRFLAEDSPVEALAHCLRDGPGFGVIKITPTHLKLLTPLLSADQARAAAHTLVVGADFLSAEATLFWQDQAPGVRLINEYGPTETVVGCSAYVLPNGRHRAGPVPVGRPIQNLRFYVLDEHRQPVAVGLPGELYIAGAGLARGYLGRPGLTAERFLPDPFAGAGERMYRSGDRARWLHDGNLVVLGRVDNQVKIRGFRVELGEVESALRRHPAVREALAVVREDRPGDRRLVAYTVGGAASGELRAHLLKSLPEYMVPNAFVALAALPHTPTGKIDPRTLPAPSRSGTRDPGGARNEEEAALIELWEETLGVAGVGPADGFFELGGDSLLALRLFAAINRRLGCDLPIATLYAHTTVREIAELVIRRRAGAPAETGPEPAHRSPSTARPASPAEARERIDR